MRTEVKIGGTNAGCIQFIVFPRQSRVGSLRVDVT
jgi:hypothetical protein